MNKKLVLISIISVLFCVILNEYNLEYLGDRYPAYNKMLTSADEASYFAPARNFIEKGIWKDNSFGFSSFYQRPPIYGALFYVCSILNPTNPYLILKIIQIILWGFAVFLMGKILSSFIHSNKIIVIATLCYGIIPSFSGFTYYTLTESLIPFVILSSVLSLIYVMKYQKYSLVMFSFWGVLLLFRPQLLIIFSGLILSYYLKVYAVVNFKKIIIQGLVFILPWTMWSVRNYNLNNEIVSVHPIYHYSNNQMYRPIHAKMTNLFRVWEVNPTVFHSHMHSLYYDTSLVVRENVYSQLPIFNQTDYKIRLLSVFKDYQYVSNELQTKFIESDYIPENAIRLEKILSQNITFLIDDLKFNYWDHYYFITPFNSFSKLIISSYLNLQIFQFKHRGSFLMESLRWFSFLLMFIGFLTLIVNIFNKNVSIWLRLLSVFSLIYIFYLSYIQRLNEDRYYVLLLPILFISIVYSIQLIIKKPHSE